MAADAAQRQRALDPGGSFIVQAPAGSGKTEVLTQRFLMLLARVERPERVLAITFTRKATQEMRSRITSRLAQAKSGKPAKSEHDRRAIELATRVLANDEARGWNLLGNPGRLRITTIDGLCTQLLGRNAVLGARWAGVRVAEDARPLYRQAVRRLFADIDELAAGQGDDTPARAAQEALVRLLIHLGGDARRLERLLMDMLLRRSLWRRHLGADRDELDAILQMLQRQALASFRHALGDGELRRAMEIVEALGFDGARQDGGLASDLRAAVAFADLLTTGSKSPRAPGGIGPKLFPGMADAQSQELQALKEIYRGWHADDAAREAIRRMAAAPPLDIPAGAEALPDSLLDDARSLLRLALVELETVMAETGQADFTAVSEAALESLGSETEPADSLLAEDARIEHILMDEFQDTSYMQFQLLRRLTAGWQAGDGRSLFLVGDPMQSIYRFREANVGFFNEVVEEGRLGQIPIESLSLSSNFRSNLELIRWYNEVFPAVFPDRDESDSGAVSYTPVEPEIEAGGAVELHALKMGDPQQNQGVRIAELVAGSLEGPAHESIAILVRARPQVQEIAQALTTAGIDFEAVEMEALTGRQVVQDLLALTRALAHPLDRIAWTALLRAPWCGLRISEIHHVVGDDSASEVLQSIGQTLGDGTLRGTAADRLARLWQVMSYAKGLVGRQSLSRLVEMCWIQLGGPLACGQVSDIENAEVFFDLLEAVEQEGDLEFIERLTEALERRRAASRPARVQVMTIHNAKGLQFDVVIVPDLGRQPGRSEQPLVALQEFSPRGSPGGVLMATLIPAWMADASLFRYLNAVDAERGRFETQRVLYVACTRARRRLHLMAPVRINNKGKVSLPANSFLEFLEAPFRPLLDALAECHMESGQKDKGEEDAESTGEPAALPLLRLRGPLPAPDLPETPAELPEPWEMQDLPNRETVALGTVLHRWLELIHDHPGQGWDAARIERSACSIRSSLARAGAPAGSLESLEARCLAILSRALRDDELMALVGAGGAENSWSELEIYRREGCGFTRHVIDLLTADESGSLRIIDYKTGSSGTGSSGTGTSGSEAGPYAAHWAGQLDRYREIVEALNVAPITEAKVHVLDGE